MSYRVVNYGKKSQRRNYSKIRTDVDLPGLIEIQTESFKWFVEEGLKEVFDDISPITSFNQDLKLYFQDYHFEEPKYGVVDSKLRRINFSRYAILAHTVKMFAASSSSILTKVRFSGFIVVSQSCSGFISPKPLYL